MQQSKKLKAARKETVDGIAGGAAIKPQRGRPKPGATRSKPEAGKTPEPKTILPRRAPSRGKYIDEYARPAV